MFDEIDRLRQTPALIALLSHYAAPAVFNREAWQDRLMEADGVKPPDMTVLHGELIAHGWLEQNTGFVNGYKPGTAALCYRITAAGLRALRLASVTDTAADEIAHAA